MFAGIKIPLDLFVYCLLPITLAGIIHARRIRRQPRQKTWYSPWYVALAALPAAVLLGAFAVRTFLYQPFYAPSLSNEPNLMLGDYFFVSKSAYGYSRYSLPFGSFDFAGRTGSNLPQRGDMSVFRLPSDTSVDYVKRVIGLPGERVEVRGGVVYINGEAAKLEPVPLAPEYTQDGAAQFFRETLPGGRSHVIKDFDPSSAGDNTEEYLVPAGHYFMMGDNRDNSQDSRFAAVGFIPAENFIGLVCCRFWNSEGFAMTGRPQERP